MKIDDIKKLTSANLLPPAKGLCRECAVDHEPQFPHNPGSLFYITKFNMDNGRVPTWADAMAHCDSSMKIEWINHLKEKGVEV